MGTENNQGRWQRTYQTKAERDVSWYQDQPDPSLRLVMHAAASLASPIIDIGGGTSHLVDHLAERGYSHVAVLDMSSAALATTQSRLGKQAVAVDWIVADVTTWEPAARYEIWHDRATFHFMVTEADRSAYLARLKLALAPGGHAIIATFALDGPEQCSGLPVMRYDSASLAETLGPQFALVATERHLHKTPWSAKQAFQFSVFRRQLEAP
jgi:2-polyprenyl-3-methyl-5-hydroxy-6-metoxy-1,4-benzoquinol methylase